MPPRNATAALARKQERRRIYRCRGARLFVVEVPWARLDLASVTDGLAPVRAHGRLRLGVRLLIELARCLAI
jgi:hypothetical protein